MPYATRISSIRLTVSDQEVIDDLREKTGIVSRAELLRLALRHLQRVEQAHVDRSDLAGHNHDERKVPMRPREASSNPTRLAPASGK